MRAIEVASAAGLSVATLKFYVREGLVTPGERVSQTSTVYDERHVRRARLVRALLETGGLSIAQARTVLATLGNDTPLADTFAVAQHTIGGTPTGPPPSDAAAARLTDLLLSRGWNSGANNPAFSLVAQVLEGLVTAGLTNLDAYLDAYIEAADAVARADLAALRECASRDEVAELMVTGTVLGDRLLAGLRRLAQQHHSTGFALSDRPDHHTHQEPS